ncbi:unnamed protein product, partial [Discosporangium mesarthrocarpum]
MRSREGQQSRPRSHLSAEQSTGGAGEMHGSLVGGGTHDAKYTFPMVDHQSGVSLVSSPQDREWDKVDETEGAGEGGGRDPGDQAGVGAGVTEGLNSQGQGQAVGDRDEKEDEEEERADRLDGMDNLIGRMAEVEERLQSKLERNAAPWNTPNPGWEASGVMKFTSMDTVSAEAGAIRLDGKGSEATSEEVEKRVGCGDSGKDFRPGPEGRGAKAGTGTGRSRLRRGRSKGRVRASKGSQVSESLVAPTVSSSNKARCTVGGRNYLKGRRSRSTGEGGRGRFDGVSHDQDTIASRSCENTPMEIRAADQGATRQPSDLLRASEDDYRSPRANHELKTVGKRGPKCGHDVAPGYVPPVASETQAADRDVGGDRGGRDTYEEKDETWVVEGQGGHEGVVYNERWKHDIGGTREVNAGSYGDHTSTPAQSDSPRNSGDKSKMRISSSRQRPLSTADSAAREARRMQRLNEELSAVVEQLHGANLSGE